MIFDPYEQGWESSSFCQNSGFLMVPGVILEISLNLGRKFYMYMYIITANS